MTRMTSMEANVRLITGGGTRHLVRSSGISLSGCYGPDGRRDHLRPSKDVSVYAQSTSRKRLRLLTTEYVQLRPRIRSSCSCPGGFSIHQGTFYSAASLTGLLVEWRLIYLPYTETPGFPHRSSKLIAPRLSELDTNPLNLTMWERGSILLWVEVRRG